AGRGERAGSGIRGRGDDRARSCHRDRCPARRTDGRRPVLRCLRAHNGPERRLLQVPQLREQPGLLV
ncbi:MAG: Ribonucleotide reductase of class II (coenzyme B12-dependent), partial [uncultured Chloroflexia bacterium]